MFNRRPCFAYIIVVNNNIFSNDCIVPSMPFYLGFLAWCKLCLVVICLVRPLMHANAKMILPSATPMDLECNKIVE